MKQFLKLLSIVALTATTTVALTAMTAKVQAFNYKDTAMQVGQRIKQAIETSPFVSKIHMEEPEPIEWEDLATYPYLQHILPEQGIMLEFYYGSLKEIRTPVGVVKLYVANALEGSPQQVREGLLAIMYQVGASGVVMTLFKDVVRNMWGEAGPFYAITSINGIAIPAVIE